MLIFVLLVLFGLVLTVATVLCVWPMLKELLNFNLDSIRSKKKKEMPKEEPVQDAEFKEDESEKAAQDSSPDIKPEQQGEYEQLTKVPGSYERVELHLSSGVDYIEYWYYDDNDQPIASAKAAKCRIRECADDGTVLRELWGKPYKNHVYDYIQGAYKKE